MNRRNFLRRGGAVALAAGLGGCLGGTSGTAPDGAASEQSDTDTETTAVSDADERFSGIDSGADAPFRTVSVGDRDSVPFPDNNRPRDFRVWNAAETERDVALTITRDDTTAFEETVTFAGDAYLEVTLNEPADYRLSVGLADGEPTSFTVERDSFDCNSTTTDVGIMADGTIESMSASTAAGCLGPEVATTDLSVTNRACGTEHSASVAFDGERVRVDGVVLGSTPRAEVALAGATYDQESDRLSVRVRTTEGGDSGGMGTQCTGEISYEATVGFDNAFPGSVAVVHESKRETVDVTTKARSDG